MQRRQELFLDLLLVSRFFMQDLLLQQALLAGPLTPVALLWAEPAGWVGWLLKYKVFSFLAPLTSHVASSRPVMAVSLSPPCSACPEMEDAWRKYFLFTQCLVLIISGNVTVANKLDASSSYFLHGSWNRL